MESATSVVESNTNTRTCTYHKNVNAVSYCTVCRSSLCQACIAAHNSYFRNAHKTVPTEPANDQNPLYEEFSEHATPPEGSKDPLKEKLSDSLRTIESQYNFVRDIPQKADKEIKKAEKEREKARTTIKQCFESVRKALELKEAEIIKAIDEDTTNDSRISGLISDAQDLLKGLSEDLAVGHTLLSGWDATSATSDLECKTATVTDKAKEITNIKRVFKETCGFKFSVDTSELEK